MNKSIYVIIDTSGSMNEMGKSHLLRNLCRFISELPIMNEKRYSDVEFRFFQWGASVSELFVESDGDIPSIHTQGSSDLSALSEMLRCVLNNGQQTRVLIFTDGNFPNSKIAQFKKDLILFPKLIMRVVAVGADADILKLKKLSSNACVYLPENISAAVNSICNGVDEKIIGPESVSQIKTVPLAEERGGWDD